MYIEDILQVFDIHNENSDTTASGVKNLEHLFPAPKYRDTQINKNFFPYRPCCRHLMFRSHGNYDEFSFPLSLIRTIFSNEDCLCHEEKRSKPSPLRSSLFCDWHQAFVRQNKVVPLSKRWNTLHFSTSGIRAPCQPINVTNFKRPLDVIHLFQHTREFILKSNQSC